MEYNIIEEHGKKVIVLKQKTAFRIVEDLLETDYLNTIIDEAIEEDGEHNPKLVEGSLISDRRALKKKLAREGIMVDLVLNRFLEQEIPYEQYIFFQQYVGSLVLKLEGAENLDLKIKRGVNHEYFRKKGIKLANLNQGANWKLHSVTDIVKGYCSLGHEIRYAFVAVNNLGEQLIFGNTCIHDFFDIDNQVAEKIEECVTKIKNITDEYYNDYHAYYKVHKNLDNFMRLMVLFINKLTDGLYFSKSEVAYVNKFVEYGLPVPRDLARTVGIKIHTFINEKLSHIYYTEKYSVVRNFIYLLHCFAQGSHGYTKYDLKGFFPTNFLGDRIMPREVAQLEKLMNSDSISLSSNEFVNKMALELSNEQFANILKNLYKLDQLTTKLEHDKDFEVLRLSAMTKQVTHKPTGIVISSDDYLMETLFGIPNLDSPSEVLHFFIHRDLPLKFGKDQLMTENTGYLGLVKNYEVNISLDPKLHKKAKQLLDFIKSNPNRVKAEPLVVRILNGDYVNESNPDSLVWLEHVIKGNGIEKDLVNGSNKGIGQDRFTKLLNRAYERLSEVKESGLGFSVQILETAVKNQSCTPKQKKYIDNLEAFLNGTLTRKESEFDKLLRKAEQNKELIAVKNLDFQVKVLKTVCKTGSASDKQMVHINKLKEVLKDV